MRTRPPWSAATPSSGGSRRPWRAPAPARAAWCCRRGGRGGQDPARRRPGGAIRPDRPAGAGGRRRRVAYAPLAQALRAHLRADPGVVNGAGGLRDHLAMVLPELGPPPADPHPPALAEAVRGVLAAATADGPLLLVLDDLHWSDDATLELVAGIAEPLADVPALVLGAYRSDGLPRDHGMRRLRHELRRRGRLAELAVGPLGPNETAALAATVLGDPPSPALVRTVPSARRACRSSPRSSAGAAARRAPWSPGRRAWRWAGRGRSPSRRPCATPCCSPPWSCRRRAAPPPTPPPSRGRPSTWCSWPTWRAPTAWPSWSSGAGSARTATAAGRSGTRSPARRSTPTSRGCAAARCTGSSPGRSRPPPPRPWRSPPTGWAPGSPTVRGPRCCGRRRSSTRSTPTATPPAVAPGAGAVAGGRGRGGAARRPGGLRAQRRAGR